MKITRRMIFALTSLACMGASACVVRSAAPATPAAAAQPSPSATPTTGDSATGGLAEATSPFTTAPGELERWVHRRMEGKGLKGSYEEREGRAMAVFYFGDEDHPRQCKVIVRSEQSATDGSEIKILYSTFSDRTFKSAEVEAALRVMNQHHRDTFLTKAYIDDDLDLVLESAINLPGRGVHEDFVYDVLLRTAKACKTVNTKLDEARLGAPKA